MNKYITPLVLAISLVLLSLFLIITFFDVKYLVVIIVAILSTAVITTIVLYMKNNTLKEYYENIINNSTNIIIETDGKEIKSANKRFYDYVKENSVKELAKNQRCICDSFVQEEGYLSKFVNNLTWLEYLTQHQDKYNKAKLLLDNKVYYFAVSAFVSLKNPSNYIVILSDITTEETYKIELKILTIKDALTGIGNRRVFETKLKEAIVISQRYHYPFSLIVFDIDFFKKVNDNYGHDIGDKVLVQYTKLISASLREGDEFCRIGGEEFVVIVPHTTKDKAYSIAQKLRAMVEEHKEILPITMSFGVTQYIKGDDDTTLYKRADEALYKAKESGRNKVMLG
jgi:diguanylate cyclase (GGDEF)-like protein